MSKRGLPMRAKTRHDSHFVEALTERFGESVGKFVSIAEIETNPDQPRQNVGDLSALRASIESKGLLEPILVRPIEGARYRIIAGERRFRAAMEAGLTEVPCIELDIPDNEVLEIALIENLHRKGLTPFEEAEGYHALIEKFRYTHQQVAQALGKSRVSITESLSLLAMPADLREECRRADIDSKRLLLQIVRSGDPEKMRATLEEILHGATREALQKQKRDDGGGGKRKGFSFHFAPKDGPFRMNLQFTRSRVSKEEVLDTLRGIIREIEAHDGFQKRKSK